MCVCGCMCVYVSQCHLSPETTCKGHFGVSEGILFNGLGEEVRFGGSGIVRLREK